MGRRLLEALLHAAAARGVRHLAGDVMRDNRPMLALAVQLGFSFGSRPADPGLVRVAIDPLAACADSDRPAHAPRASWTEELARRLVRWHKKADGEFGRFRPGDSLEQPADALEGVGALPGQGAGRRAHEHAAAVRPAGAQ